MDLPDIHDYCGVIKFAKGEAIGFRLHPNFVGGRFQTAHPCIFLHIREDGTLGKIEINKPGGSLFYLKP